MADEREQGDIARFLLSHVFDAPTSGEALAQFNQGVDAQLKQRNQKLVSLAQARMQAKGWRNMNTPQHDPESGYTEEITTSPGLRRIQVTSTFTDPITSEMLSREVSRTPSENPAEDSPAEIEFTQQIEKVKPGYEPTLKVVTTSNMAKGLDVCLSGDDSLDSLLYIAHYRASGELRGLSFAGYSMKEKLVQEALEDERLQRRYPASEDPEVTLDKLFSDLEKEVDRVLENEEGVYEPYAHLQLRNSPLFEALIYEFADTGIDPFLNIADLAEQVTTRSYLTKGARREWLYGRNIDFWMGKKNLRVRYADVDGSTGIDATAPLWLPVQEIGGLLNDPGKDWIRSKSLLPFRFAVPALGLEFDSRKKAA